MTVSTARTFDLTLQEALRTVGLSLEAGRVPRATLVLDEAGISVQTQVDYGYRTFSWADIAGLSRSQRAQRQPAGQPPPWLDPLALTRWSVVLRVVGRLLDERQLAACRIEAAPAPPGAPDACAVVVTLGDQPVFDQAAVRECLDQLRALRRSRAEPPRQPRGPWWAFWRR
jgi:hypothetical protein